MTKRHVLLSILDARRAARSAALVLKLFFTMEKNDRWRVMFGKGNFAHGLAKYQTNYYRNSPKNIGSIYSELITNFVGKKMRTIFFLMLFAFCLSCTARKQGIVIKFRANSNLYQDMEKRNLFDSISSRSLQLKKGNKRTLTFIQNFNVENSFDTTYFEIFEDLIVFDIDSIDSYRNKTKGLFVEVEPTRYYLSDGSREKITLVFLKDGFLDFPTQKYIKFQFGDESLIYRRGLFAYKLVR